MEYTKLGYTDLKVSRLCLGGMSFGSSKWMADQETSSKIIKKAIDFGINFIDTANLYSSGESEKIIGEAIIGYRNQLVLSTKGGGKLNDFTQGFSRAILFNELKNSLKNLRTDYIDIYFLHTIFDNVDFRDTVHTLSSFISSGKVGYIGLSNFMGYQLAEFFTIMEMQENVKPAILQNHYNAVYREDERDSIPFCEKHGIAYSPFSPIAAGFLSGKYKRGAENETVRTKTYPVMKKRYFDDSDFDVLESIEEIAKNRGINVSQLALAYVLNKGFIPVIGATKLEYLEDDISALDIHLSKEEMESIERNYIPHKIVKGTAGY
jgi:aryl-alcohol dehydrogenase-like predicted oxidoreductase